MEDCQFFFRTPERQLQKNDASENNIFFSIEPKAAAAFNMQVR